MTRINCSACNCGYNENKTCKKMQIDVEGVFAKSKIGTFCESFISPTKESTLNEMAKEMFSENQNQETKINCSANYCKYNQNNICNAERISIGTPQSKYRSETECDSFELK